MYWIGSPALIGTLARFRAVVIRAAGRDTISLCYGAEIVGNGLGVLGQVGRFAVVADTLVEEVLRKALIRLGSLVPVKAQGGTLANLRSTPYFLGRLRDRGYVLCIDQSWKYRPAGKNECKESELHRVEGYDDYTDIYKRPYSVRTAEATVRRSEGEGEEVSEWTDRWDRGQMGQPGTYGRVRGALKINEGLQKAAGWGLLLLFHFV